ncbi:pre-peptidase C-terminal domain-containing protein [Leptothermofonsia sp. ETS-13]|uniref:pre-peptidase C-terminal domain-containing protein n=1 Tax=Leptothermofonsia sp. ETS-13 TaxID=3035696 RepID=UPI003BA25D1C
MFAPDKSTNRFDVCNPYTPNAGSLGSKATALLKPGALPGLSDALQDIPQISRSSAPPPNNPPGISDFISTSIISTDLIDSISIHPFFSDNYTFGANNLGTLQGLRTAVNFVGSSDTRDYFRFHLDATTRFNLSLTGMTADADVQLLDGDGNLIAGSYQGGTSDEAINRASLAVGDYYVRVYQYSGNTNYTLNISANYPSNLLPTETNLGTLTSGVASNSSGFISTTNTTDVYRFNLGSTGNLNLALNGLSADADVRIIRDANSNGIVDIGEEIIRSANGGSTAESINLQGLGAGSYFAQVYQWSGTTSSTSYNLSLTAYSGLGWATEPNNTLGNAYNLRTLNGSRSFSGWVSGNSSYFYDANDYYRFSLGTDSNFSLSLSGLSADADVQLIRDANFNGTVDVGEVIASSTLGSSFSESISLSGLEDGTYFVRVYPFGGAATSYTLNLTGTPVNQFASFSVSDAANDGSLYRVFEDGALRFNYNLAGTAAIASVRLEAINGSSVTNLGTWYGSSLTNGLINLSSFSGITTGDYQLRAVALTTGGTEFISATQNIQVVPWARTNGTFAGETLNYSAAAGTGAVFLGRGGTDTLNLGIARSSIASINGLSLVSFNPLTNSTWNQAFFGGTAFDYLSLTDGREIYFQGIENLRFSDGSTLELQVRPNDTFYNQQWNLHVSDVSSAWRFSRGSSNVLLASLDTGILTAAGATGGITDISTGRLITDSTDDDNFANYGHGHSAISVMASTANNSSGVAGINWNSNVYVTDVYSGVNLQQAIQDTIAYARARNQRVVFQGGIQGESWLTNGGTQAQLEQLIQDNSDIAFFAIAAGNGGPGGNLSDSNYLTSVSGVAKLQTGHSNVMSVGALQRTGTATVNGLTNASAVDLASYSNRGSNLTMVAATNSPAMDKFGNLRTFGGTSAANPNMAGIASLVWSVNGNLDGGQLRQVMVDTAMDLGTAGRDNTFGSGLVNADAAVRRAYTLGRQYDLANLYSGASLFR